MAKEKSIADLQLVCNQLDDQARNMRVKASEL